VTNASTTSNRLEHDVEYASLEARAIHFDLLHCDRVLNAKHRIVLLRITLKVNLRDQRFVTWSNRDQVKVRAAPELRGHYRKELALTREMLATEPANAQFRRNEAVALVNMGNLEGESGNNAKALSHYQQALRIREQLSVEAQEDLTIRRELAEVWLKLGDVLSKTGSRSQALENYRKSVETLEALSVSIPTHAGIRELLAEAHSRVAR
jgi:tetratricopeptide (TPR) repeat protein